jgi:RimJ/RimL family protein N-acetyltransferase
MALNSRSQALMRRVGMTTDPAEDFDDPDVDEAALRRHVVYRKLRTLISAGQLAPRFAIG